VDTDVTIIGGGVVGLACAVEFAQRKLRTMLVERHDSFGQETSSRNSEVIHSGIYYATGSIRARLCLPGNDRTYADCERLDVWHRRCGKLIVAVGEDEVPVLEKLLEHGKANGLTGLELLDERDAKKLEPNIACRKAIFVPSTGIVDSHELMKAYLNEARRMGADCLFGIDFLGAEPAADGYALEFKDMRGEKMTLSTGMVVNAAGLSASAVAAKFGIDIAGAGYVMHPNRGHYYRVSMTKSRMVSRLVYPVPPPKLVGLGIHITLDRAGQMKLGPDNEYVDQSKPESEWYKFDESRMEKFYTAVVRYFPALGREDLTPDQVGVRPKLQAPGEPLRDWVIQEESARGLPRLVNLIGIESPGLTCARVIAEEVAAAFRLRSL
jgi:L-2-hydroxyglutarate oxidase LhgO